ncbi:hypothetical protein VNO77_35951 [Canavalia gladiata]|uniref:Uncharacterized protein n=1 Tax=Canavalia gladiata TaxID=3824 RepID=A0AAN9PVE8_CANGL
MVDVIPCSGFFELSFYEFSVFLCIVKLQVKLLNSWMAGRCMSMDGVSIEPYLPHGGNDVWCLCTLYPPLQGSEKWGSLVAAKASQILQAWGQSLRQWFVSSAAELQ